MRLGLAYMDGMQKQAKGFFPALQAMNKFMNRGLWERVTPRLATKYKGAGGWRGGLYNTANFLSKPVVGMVGGIGGTMGLGAMANSENETIRGIGNSAALNIGAGIMAPGWTALDKIPNMIGNYRLSRPDMRKKLVDDAKVGARSAVGDFLSLASSGVPVHQPGSYLNALDAGYGSPQATANARERYLHIKRPHEMSTFEKLWRPSEDLVQHGINQKMYEFDKEAKISIPGAGRVAGFVKRLFGGGKPKPAPAPTAGHLPPPPPVAPVTPPTTPAPSGPMTGWDKAKTLGGAAMTLGFGGGMLYGGAKKIFGTPYDPEQVQREAQSATQAAIQKRFNNMNMYERFAMKMDPTLAVGYMEDYLPGSVRQWEQSTGRRYNQGFLSAIKDKATGPNAGKFYEFDNDGNQRFL